MEARAWRKIS